MLPFSQRAPASEDVNSVRTLKRGLEAEHGEEDVQVKNYEIGFSYIVMVCIALFSAQDAYELFHAHHTHNRTKKVEAFGVIAEKLILTPITLIEGNRSMQIGKKFLFIENPDQSIIIRDIFSHEETTLPGYKSLEDLKVKALLYKAAKEIHNEGREGKKPWRLCLTQFILLENTSGEFPTVDIRSWKHTDSIKLCDGTLEKIRSDALSYLRKPKSTSTPGERFLIKDIEMEARMHRAKIEAQANISSI